MSDTVPSQIILQSITNCFIISLTYPNKGHHLSEGERRLAEIMYTDIVGYKSLTQMSEALAMQLLEMHRRVVRPFFLKHNGREVKTMEQVPPLGCAPAWNDVVLCPRFPS